MVRISRIPRAPSTDRGARPGDKALHCTCLFKGVNEANLHNLLEFINLSVVFTFDCIFF